jgi:hypothetical protein
MTLEQRVEQLEKEMAELKAMDFMRRPTAESIVKALDEVADNINLLQKYESTIPLSAR